MSQDQKYQLTIIVLKTTIALQIILLTILTINAFTSKPYLLAP